MIPSGGFERLLTSREVADMMRVRIETVTRWGRDGKFTDIRTPGGRHRYRESEVRALMRGEVLGNAA